MSPQANANGGGGGTAILVDTDALRKVADDWLASVPDPGTLGEAPGNPDGLKHWTDEASAAVYQAVVDWPLMDFDRLIHWQTMADHLVLSIYQTAQVFSVSDQSNADRISGIVEQPPTSV